MGTYILDLPFEIGDKVWVITDPSGMAGFVVAITILKNDVFMYVVRSGAMENEYHEFELTKDKSQVIDFLPGDDKY